MPSRCGTGCANGGPRTAGPICPDALADHIVKLHGPDLAAVFNGVIRALAEAGVLAAQLTGIVDATDLETTAQYEGCGQATRRREITAKRGEVHALEVTVYGWQLSVLLEARTRIPVAAAVVPIRAHETLSLRALVTPARANLAGYARLSKGIFDNGLLAGVALWWLAQHGLLCVVPATDNMAVTVDARAQAASGDDVTIGHRGHAVRQGRGRTAWTERLETEVVGIAGLTT
jgi:hypothetical protein